jgi:hypothetical protein
MPRAKRKPNGRDFTRQVAKVRESAAESGLLEVALERAAESCPNPSVQALLREMAQRGTDRGARIIDQREK